MRLRHSIPLLLTLLLPPAALTQSPPAAAVPNLISLRLLDAETGESIPNLKALVYGEAGGKPLPISPLGDLYEVDITGHVSLDLGAITATSNDTEFTACIPQNIWFDIKQIQAKGIASPNKCSKKTHLASPGELVIFIRRTHWWERWKNMD